MADIHNGLVMLVINRIIEGKVGDFASPHFLFSWIK